MINIVLVRPIYARNVGMVARSMENYGANRLILIDPKTKLGFEANQGAANGQRPLEEITIYKSWKDFYKKEPEGFRIAFSCRSGKSRQVEKYSDFLSQNKIPKDLFLIFGPEDMGLSDDDLDKVNAICEFNIPGKIKSMNLSHAVNTALTLLNEVNLKKAEKRSIKAKDYPLDSMQEFIKALHIDISSHNKVNIYTVLKKMILRSYPTDKEWRMLEIVFRQSVRKLGEYQKYYETIVKKNKK